MKNIFKLFLIMLIAVPFSSCTKKFDEINTNPKALTVAELDQSLYGFIVRRAIYGPSYLRNGNGMQTLHSLFFDTYANYFATTTPNFLSDRYVLVASWINGSVNAFYRDCAPQIKYSVDYAKEKGFGVEEAMMTVWKVYCFHRYTDCLGPIPYSQYGNMQKSVAYDSQQEIYTSFFSELDAAIRVLKENAGTTSSIISSYDAIYSGNVDKWLKFANSLRLRLAMRVKYADATLAKTNAEAAVADGVITSNADNGWVKTTKDWYNAYNTITSWGEFRMSADMESILKGYCDPRVKSYFQEAVTPDKIDDPVGVTFNFEGMRNGQSKGNRSGIAFNSLASDMAKPWVVLGDKGPDWYVMRASESYFLKAEGALEGWNMGSGTAQSFYEAGIKASLEENGYANLKNLAGEDYITSLRTPASPGSDPAAPSVILNPVSKVPVAFMASGSKEQKLEQIITQKWIGLYPDSQEAYAERRRTGYPILYTRIDSENPDIPAKSLPRRLTFWTTEYNTNGAEVANGINKLNAESSDGHGDLGTTRLWWDKNPNVPNVGNEK
ncbi:MAG: SusD/RagB family nutrient-binding outer membrane lipoprotein [Bacteroidales bacterium]|nr:SusD/RagB family nutrient-binding outer membrane lipoprotein [Bacteroidales bacterium]